MSKTSTFLNTEMVIVPSIFTFNFIFETINRQLMKQCCQMVKSRCPSNEITSTNQLTVLYVTTVRLTGDNYMKTCLIESKYCDTVCIQNSQDAWKAFGGIRCKTSAAEDFVFH
ncbi:hypothetical protein ACF0H5_006919 [Mactra antiquata]